MLLARCQHPPLARLQLILRISRLAASTDAHAAALEQATPVHEVARHVNDDEEDDEDDDDDADDAASAHPPGLLGLRASGAGVCRQNGREWRSVVMAVRPTTGEKHPNNTDGKWLT